MVTEETLDENIVYIKDLLYYKNLLFILAVKLNKEKSAMSLLYAYHAFYGYDLQILEIFDHKDEFGKSALNYATLNNMKHIVLKILEIKKCVKNTNNTTNNFDYNTLKRLKIIPFNANNM